MATYLLKEDVQRKIIIDGKQLSVTKPVKLSDKQAKEFKSEIVKVKTAKVETPKVEEEKEEETPIKEEEIKK